MTRSAETLPFGLREIDDKERAARDRLADQFPGTGAVLAMPKLESVLRASAVRLTLTGMTPTPRYGDGEGVTVALSATADSRSPRSVLALSSRLARHLVELCLGRSPASDDRRPPRPLTAGEEGVLLYTLDHAGGDWKAAGGAPFVIRSLLADPAQTSDYLGGPPSWEITGALRVDRFAGAVVLYSNQPTAGAARPERLRYTACRGWTTRVRVTAGQTRVPAAALDDIAPGDIVTLDACRLPDTAGGPRFPLLTSGRWTCFGRWLDKRRIEVISTMDGENDMHDIDHDHTINGAVSHTRDNAASTLEVIITAEVGEVKMSVEEASSLMPGRILKLDREVGPDVLLRAGDHVIGRGRLVSYEGDMAVEIKELS